MFSGPCFPACASNSKRIGDDFSIMPSRMRLEARSQYNLKFDAGASTLDAPPRPREAQRPPGVQMSSCTPASMVDLLPSASCRHVCIVLNGPQVTALRSFSPAYLFRRFDSVSTSRPKHSPKRLGFDLRFTITILFGHAL